MVGDGWCPLRMAELLLVTSLIPIPYDRMLMLLLYARFYWLYGYMLSIHVDREPKACKLFNGALMKQKNTCKKNSPM